jgi:hypothetical protein
VAQLITGGRLARLQSIELGHGVFGHSPLAVWDWSHVAQQLHSVAASRGTAAHAAGACL